MSCAAPSPGRPEEPLDGRCPPVARGRRLRPPPRRGDPWHAALLTRPSARGARRSAPWPNRAPSCSPTSPIVAVGVVGQDIVVGDLPHSAQPRNLRRADPAAQAARHRAHRVRTRRDRPTSSPRWCMTHQPSRAQRRARTRRARRPPMRSSARRACRTSGSAASSWTSALTPRRPTSRPSAGSTSRPRAWPRSVWEAAQARGHARPARGAQTLIEQLVQAVAQNRTALLALTALKEYDNYTFTHMVNVSILTMAQARALGIDGMLLREFGLAGADARHRQGADADRDPAQAR